MKSLHPVRPAGARLKIRTRLISRSAIVFRRAFAGLLRGGFPCALRNQRPVDGPVIGPMAGFGALAYGGGGFSFAGEPAAPAGCRSAPPSTVGARAPPKPTIPMKTRHLVTFLAISAALPLAGWSQSSTSGSSSGSTGANSNSGTWNNNNTNDANPNAPGSSSSGSDRMNSTNSGTYTPSTSGASSYNMDSGYTGNSTADIRRVSEDRLDSRLTAKSLIGQKVVDQSGKEIGRVKDIGLSGVLPQDLQKSSADNRSGMGSSSSGSGSDLSSSSGSMSATGSSSGMGSGMTSAGLSSSRNVPVYVSVGGFLGAGSELVSIPANKLSRDGDNLKVQMSESQIKSLTSNDSNSRSGSSSSSNSDTSSTSSH
jgi:hypothetical protein